MTEPKSDCCIYCGGKRDIPGLFVCKRCCEIWNENYEKICPVNDERMNLVKRCEKYVKQAMTGHTCGQECGGDPDSFCSSDCYGCFPDTQQHYRNAAEMVIAWTLGWVEENVMKNIFLPCKPKGGRNEDQNY